MGKLRRTLEGRPARLRVFALSLCLLCTGMGSALAQDDKRASREREALRRSQIALQAAQDQLAVSQREKDKAIADLARVETERATERAAGRAEASALLSAAQGQARAQRERAERLQAELTRLQADKLAQGESATQQQKQHEIRLEAEMLRAVELRRELAERTAANNVVTGLLERSVASLAKAEQDNRALYAVAEDILSAFRNKGLRESIAQRDPFFGLKAVELENRAEELRARMAQHRLASPVLPASR